MKSTCMGRPPGLNITHWGDRRNETRRGLPGVREYESVRSDGVVAWLVHATVVDAAPDGATDEGDREDRARETCNAPVDAGCTAFSDADEGAEHEKDDVREKGYTDANTDIRPLLSVHAS